MPVAVIRPIWAVTVHVYQTPPSEPSVMPFGMQRSFEDGKWSTTPLDVMRPMLFVPGSVNHMLPSGPGTIVVGRLPAGSGYSVIVAAGTRHGRSAPAIVSARARPRVVLMSLSLLMAWGRIRRRRGS